MKNKLLPPPKYLPGTSAEDTFLPLLPLKNVIILPKSILPIIVGRPQSIKAVEYALKHDKMLFISTQKNMDIEHPTGLDVFEHGTRSIILQVMRTPNGGLKILVEGLDRAIIESHENREGFFGVHYANLPTTPTKKTIELEALWRHLRSLYAQYASHNEKVPADLMATADSLEEMDTIADTLQCMLI